MAKNCYTCKHWQESVGGQGDCDASQSDAGGPKPDATAWAWASTAEDVSVIPAWLVTKRDHLCSQWVSKGRLK